MLEREAKREKNLEKRAIELARRARATEAESKTAEKAASGKDEKMEEILRRVDGEFLSLIKVGVACAWCRGHWPCAVSLVVTFSLAHGQPFVALFALWDLRVSLCRSLRRPQSVTSRGGNPNALSQLTLKSPM